MNELIKKLDEKPVIAVDTETTSLNPQEADLVGISICYEANQALYPDRTQENRIKKKFSFRKT